MVAFSSVRPKPRKKGPDLTPEQLQEQLRRTRMPRGRELFGVVERRLGGSRMTVRCLDGKSRIARIPGRLKRSLWVREGDFVIIEPWELSGDEKCDIVYKYRPNQVQYLRSKGLFKQLEELDEF
jgi:translation initiation factor 1A